MSESVKADISAPLSSLSLVSIPTQTQGLLLRMFADPRVLAKNESADLVAQLRECVAQQPDVAELRVLLGMALCVNLDAQAAMEELGEAVSLAPESFIAHLKMGELWMRLRVMPKAEDHTRQAALLAQNLAQSELARRQAATIRTMMREGIERGGYRTPWFSLARVKLFWKRNHAKTKELVTVDAS
jgi:tetratricopeptide (TPR) repeat protein